MLLEFSYCAFRWHQAKPRCALARLTSLRINMINMINMRTEGYVVRRYGM